MLWLLEYIGWHYQGHCCYGRYSHELIVDWDNTGLQYVPVSSWTMEKQGSRQGAIAGNDDKRQVSVVLACSMAGTFLPPQVIYKGKTPSCLSSYTFLGDWDVTYSYNHWANEDTSLQHITKIIPSLAHCSCSHGSVPYVFVDMILRSFQ